MQTEKYPFDFDAMQKGDLIPAEIIESIVKLPRTDRQFALKLLGLKEQIEDELDARGRPVVAKCERDGIKILTDEEARPYTEQQFKIGARKLRRAHLKTCLIDQSNLNDEDRKLHDSQMLIQGAKLAAFRRVRPNLSVDPHESQIPKIEG